MRSYVAAFIIATLVAAVVTPLVRRAALKLGAVSEAGGRNVHVTATPRLGGIAIYLAVLLPVVGLLFVESGVAIAFKANIPVVVGLGVGGLAMCGMGVVDDLWNVRARNKLIGQLLVAALAFGCGFRIDAVALPFLGRVSMGVFALPVTMIWIVGIINALNLIDGLDGLAAGVAFFAGLTNLVVAYMGGGVIAALIMSAMLGSLMGFLFYNFNPARIFMGDSGSYLLGYVLAVTPLVGPHQKGPAAVALLVPVLALGVPIFDTVFTVARRFLERRPIFSPDRGHIHHRLLDLGITHRRAVLILYGVSVVLTVAAIAVYLGRSWQVGVALLVSSVVIISLARFAGLMSVMHSRRRQQTRMRSRETEKLRFALPSLVPAFEAARSEEELFEELTAFAEHAGLAHVTVSQGEQDAFSFRDGGGGSRQVVATMSYPLGADALATACMIVSARNDFEQPEMSPQTEILLQVVADLLAVNLLRLGSELAPRAWVQPHDQGAQDAVDGLVHDRRSHAAAAVKL